MDIAQRAELAQTALRDCRLCPRDCRVDRNQGRSGAFCRLDGRAWVYKELLSLGEEPAISPTMLVDLGGCSLRCLFCSEWEHVVQPERHGAVELSGAWLAARIAKRKTQGARTLSFVGGDPTPSLPAVLAALQECRDPLPIVWNCNGLLSPQAAELLDGLVATWVIDHKFGNPACAARLAGVRGFDYAELVERSFQLAGQTPMQSGLPTLVVRHLLMPGHLECCTRPLLHELAARLPAGSFLNLMTAYVPPAASRPIRRRPELAQWNDSTQVAVALALARALLDGRLLVDGAPPVAMC